MSVSEDEQHSLPLEGAANNYSSLGDSIHSTESAGKANRRRRGRAEIATTVSQRSRGEAVDVTQAKEKLSGSSPSGYPAPKPTIEPVVAREPIAEVKLEPKVDVAVRATEAPRERSAPPSPHRSGHSHSRFPGDKAREPKRGINPSQQSHSGGAYNYEPQRRQRDPRPLAQAKPKPQGMFCRLIQKIKAFLGGSPSSQPVVCAKSSHSSKPETRCGNQAGHKSRPPFGKQGNRHSGHRHSHKHSSGRGPKENH